jgi:hypothetical protein
MYLSMQNDSKHLQTMYDVLEIPRDAVGIPFGHDDGCVASQSQSIVDGHTILEQELYAPIPQVVEPFPRQTTLLKEAQKRFDDCDRDHGVVAVACGIRKHPFR